MTGADSNLMGDSPAVRMQRFARQTLTGVAVAVVAFLIAALAQVVGVSPLVQAEFWIYDHFLALRAYNSTNTGPPIAIILIDLEKLTKSQKYDDYITDGALADLLKRVLDDKPVVVGVDVLRNEPTGSGIAKLIKVLQDNPNVIMSEFLAVAGNGLPSPLDTTLRNALGGADRERLGFEDCKPDGDSIVRRGFIYRRTGKDPVFSLAYLVAAYYLENTEPNISFGVSGEDYLIGPRNTRLRKLHPSDGGYVQLDAGGYQFLIDFKEKMFDTYTFQENFNNVNFMGKVVLIGYRDVKDAFLTPLHGDPSFGEPKIPGVELHAHVVSQLIRMGYAKQPSGAIEPAPAWLKYGWILACSLGASVYGTLARSYAKFGTGLCLNLLAIFCIAGIALDLGDLWIPSVPAALAIIVSGNCTKIAARRWLRIFINYASEDATRVQDVYACLRAAGHYPWIDRQELLEDAGHLYSNKIAGEIRQSDRFIACLSENSLRKTVSPADPGNRLKDTVLANEIQQALDIWNRRLDSEKYLLPVRLEDCAIPEQIEKIQWVDFFGAGGCRRLRKALSTR